MRVRLHDVGGTTRSRLLVVLDGPEYQRLLALLRRLAARGKVKPHRVALVDPDDRMETYSASAAFAHAFAAAVAPLPGRRVGLGCSLGPRDVPRARARALRRALPRPAPQLGRRPAGLV